MARSSGMRLCLITGLGITLLVASGLASAQVQNDDQFYSLLTAQSSGLPPITSAKPASRGQLKSTKVADQSRDASAGPASLMNAAGPETQSAPIPPPGERQGTITSTLLSLTPATWAMLLAAVAAFGALLWAATPLPCLVLGHRRSSKSVRFDPDEQRWVGHCKSCGKRLARREGIWRPTPPTWRKPQVLLGPDLSIATSHCKLVAKSGPVDTGEATAVEWPLPELNEPQSGAERLPLEHRAQAVVSRLMDDATADSVPTPGTRGALFSVVDELRSRCAKDEWTLCAEKISIRMQELEKALQQGDNNEATLARGDLKALAGRWKDARLPVSAEAD